MRVNLNVAIVAMVNNTSNEPSNTSRNIVECPELLPVKTEDKHIVFKGEQYNWNSREQGIILGSFYYVYFAIQLLGGLLSERFGAKWCFGIGIGMSGVLSLLTPLAARWGTAAFIAVRVLEGLFQGVTYPSITTATSRWSPKEERSRISTIVFMGVPMGIVVSMSVSGWLSSTDLLGGWPSVFYVFGTVCLIWFLFWSTFMYEFPADHPGISKEELQYIEKDQEEKLQKIDVPWKDIFTSLPMWAVAAAHFGYIFGSFMLVMEMPSFLNQILHFEVDVDGLLSSLPYIAQVFGCYISSYVADRLRKSGKFSITAIRKCSNSIGMIGPGLCMLGVTVSGCSPWITVTLSCVALAFCGCTYSGFNVTHVDMSPELAGILYGMTNTLASLNGIICPTIAGYFLMSGPTIANWNKVFYITSAMFIVPGIIFHLFASAEKQPWGLTTEKDSKCEVTKF
ncbi:hypothetical protein CDAR_277931 [Caerostris darwini]|uniref:Major facilitator superfamily (MFS) profile domain-containing protein n=1 Tax=Caerostris darwini TaxID=1538125 RepID=A0AAV4PGS1_9ARAC|nr:hypothetical protein CDAR_277931 [Caerostris darwini]